MPKQINDMLAVASVLSSGVDYIKPMDSKSNNKKEKRIKPKPLFEIGKIIEIENKIFKVTKCGTGQVQLSFIEEKENSMEEDEN